MSETYKETIGQVFQSGSLARTVVITAALVPIADWLLFGHAGGCSFFLFALAIASGIVLGCNTRAIGWSMFAAATLLIATLWPLVEGGGPLAIGFALAGLIGFSLVANRRLGVGRHGLAFSVAAFVATGVSWLVRDIYTIKTRSRRRSRQRISLGLRLVSWIIPILLCTIFLMLLSSANPLIEDWVVALDPRAWLSGIDFSRILFWTAIPVLVWPFLRPRIRGQVWTPALTTSQPLAPEAWEIRLFGPSAILRSLVLFNALFAIQSLLDIVYLWHGAALPDHLSYAAYAHRGAYPLVVTALLAGLFLIAATQKDNAAGHSPAIRVLIHLWTGQNLFLVASSILRLNLYVQSYSLSYLRLAAFIWMLLTAAGLILILVRMVLDKSNGWLVAGNFWALATVLYGCSFIDFPKLIADYNVRHSLELSGSGMGLDIAYLANLGPDALPALDTYAARVPRDLVILCKDRQFLIASFHTDPADWRGWSLRRWRLDRYLTSPAAIVADRACAPAPVKE